LAVLALITRYLWVPVRIDHPVVEGITQRAFPAFSAAVVILAFLWYSTAEPPVDTSLAAGLIVIGVVHLVFQVPDDAFGMTTNQIIICMVVGTLTGLSLIVVAGKHRTAPKHRDLLRLAGMTATTLGALIVVLELIVRTGFGATPAADFSSTGAVEAGTAIVTAAAASAAALLLGSRADDAGGVPRTWLPAALIIGAFAGLHFALAPAGTMTHVSTGDVLQTAAMGVLAFGIGSEIVRQHRRQWSSHHQLAQQHHAQSELGWTIAHDLANETACLRNLALYLHRNWEEMDEAGRAELLSRLERGSATIRDLLDTGLVAFQQGSGNLPVLPQSVPVRTLVRGAIEAEWDLRDRIVVTEEPGTEETLVLADPARMQQVFRNLLSNAGKFAPEGSPIGFRVRSEDERILFSVSDEGPGIPGPDPQAAFEPFIRLAADGGPGWGVGLSICRKLVDAHGGAIWIEGAAGGPGTTVTVALLRLPALTESASA
jgi:signal transduction histidine kinase